MGSPSPSLISSTMHTFVLLSIVSLAFAAPMPEAEEAPAALPYVHDATGDVAEEYVHVEPGSCCGPCCCSRCDIRCLPLRRCIRRTRSRLSLRFYHTGCVNNVGSVVPCA